MTETERKEIIEELCTVMKELCMDPRSDQRNFYMNRINLVLNILGVHSWDCIKEITNE